MRFPPAGRSVACGSCGAGSGLVLRLSGHAIGNTRPINHDQADFWALFGCDYSPVAPSRWGPGLGDWIYRLPVGFALDSINAMLGIIHRGLGNLGTASSIDRRRFVLAFPKVKAHGTALKWRPPFISILEYSFIYHRFIYTPISSLV